MTRNAVYRSTKLRTIFLENDIVPTNDTYNQFLKWNGAMSPDTSGFVQRMETYVQERKQEHPTHPVTVQIKKDGAMPFSISYDKIRGIKSLIQNLENRYEEGKHILCRDFDEKTYDNDEFTEVEDGETIYVKNHSTNEKFRSCHIDLPHEYRHVYVYNFTVNSEPIYLEHNKLTNKFQLFSELEDETIGDETSTLTDCLESNTRNWSSEIIFNVARLYQSHRYVY
jgi:hypothetical protein